VASIIVTWLYGDELQVALRCSIVLTNGRIEMVPSEARMASAARRRRNSFYLLDGVWNGRGLALMGLDNCNLQLR